MNRLTLLAIVLLLLAPTATAGPGRSVADVTATSAEWGDALTVQGSLVSFHSLGRPNSQAPLDALTASPTTVVPPRALDLRGERVRIETDIQPHVRVLAADTPSDPSTETQMREHAIASSLLAGEDAKFFLAPWTGHEPPQVELGSDFGSWETGSDEVQGADPNVVNDARPPLRADDQPSLGWAQPDGWVSLRIEGDFAIALWDWDLRLTDAEGTVMVRSGSETEPVVADPLPVSQGEDRQVYLFVEDGVLEFSFYNQVSARLNVAHPRAASEGRVHFTDAQGEVRLPDGTSALRGDDLDLAGDLEVALEPSPGGLQAVVTGSPTEARLAGAVIPYPEAGGGASLLALVVVTVPLVVGLAGAAGYGGRRWHLSRRMGRLEGAMDGEDYATVASRMPRALLRSRRHGTDAHVMHAVSLLRLGRLEEATTLLSGWTAGPRATLDYLWACLHALEGRRLEAVKRLKECLRHDPSLRPDVAANPMFTPLLAELRLAPAASAHREGYT